MVQISKPPVPVKMYRHFAVVTLVLTASLAIFADGENRQAVAEEIESRERENDLQRKSAELTGPPKLSRREAEVASTGWGEDAENGAFGNPMDETGGMVSRVGSGAAAASRDVVIPGYSQAYLDSLSDEEFERLLATLQASGEADAAQRQRDLRRLERMSAARSGNAAQSLE